MFAFASSPAPVLLNVFISLKSKTGITFTVSSPGHLSLLLPSLDLAPPLTPLSDGRLEDEAGWLDDICTPVIVDQGPVVVINILKIRNQEMLDKYTNTALFKFFPAINNRVLVAGTPR